MSLICSFKIEENEYNGYIHNQTVHAVEVRITCVLECVRNEECWRNPHSLKMNRWISIIRTGVTRFCAVISFNSTYMKKCRNFHFNSIEIHLNTKLCCEMRGWPALFSARKEIFVHSSIPILAVLFSHNKQLIIDTALLKCNCC